MLAKPDIIALAHQLHRLRVEGRQVVTGRLVSVPEALEDAIEVQSQLSKLEGAAANAWKVAKSPGGDPVAAPLHPYLTSPLGAVLPWLKGTKIEVEIAVELGRDLPVPTERSYERAEILAAISNVYLGAEMVWSCISEGGTISFPAFLADRLGNMGYVRGPTLPLDILQPGSDFPLTLSLNGQVAFDAAGQHPTKDPLTWLSDYANDRSRPATALKVGMMITTGSLCGAIEVPGPGDVSIKLGEHAVLTFELRERARQGA
ncbi:2-keto-4-pentenoate hydratase [Rhizobium sp. RCC_161_2]|uniref:2-keto-4-pentenoate hydratase n=1 Tax=Rhizobium sp. RCC_161_2 TaxID=3239219 RepID=UPI003523DDDA